MESVRKIPNLDPGFVLIPELQKQQKVVNRAKLQESDGYLSATKKKL
jgi:hypothetical protein